MRVTEVSALYRMKDEYYKDNMYFLNKGKVRPKHRVKKIRELQTKVIRIGHVDYYA